MVLRLLHLRTVLLRLLVPLHLLRRPQLHHPLVTQPLLLPLTPQLRHPRRLRTTCRLLLPQMRCRLRRLKAKVASSKTTRM